MVLQALGQTFEVLGESIGLTLADLVDHNVAAIQLLPQGITD